MIIRAYIDGIDGSEISVDTISEFNGRAQLRTALICRIRSREFTVMPTAFLQDDGRWKVDRSQIIHGQNATVIGWKQPEESAA